MSGHLHKDTSLYYITFFVERHISKTSSLLLTDTSHLPRKQYNYSLSWILLYYKYFKTHVVSKVALAWLHKPATSLKV